MQTWPCLSLFKSTSKDKIYDKEKEKNKPFDHTIYNSYKDIGTQITAKSNWRQDEKYATKDRNLNICSPILKKTKPPISTNIVIYSRTKSLRKSYVHHKQSISPSLADHGFTKKISIKNSMTYLSPEHTITTSSYRNIKKIGFSPNKFHRDILKVLTPKQTIDEIAWHKRNIGRKMEDTCHNLSLSDLDNDNDNDIEKKYLANIYKNTIPTLNNKANLIIENLNFKQFYNKRQIDPTVESLWKTELISANSKFFSEKNKSMNNQESLIKDGNNNNNNNNSRKNLFSLARMNREYGCNEDNITYGNTKKRNVNLGDYNMMKKTFWIHQNPIYQINSKRNQHCLMKDEEIIGGILTHNMSKI